MTKPELNPEKKKFETGMVKQPSDAAWEWFLFKQNKADDFVFVDRTKDW